MPPFSLAPPQEREKESHEPIVALAFDLTEMDLDQMWKMNSYLPAIKQCFQDSSEEGDQDLHATLDEWLIEFKCTGNEVQNQFGI